MTEILEPIINVDEKLLTATEFAQLPALTESTQRELVRGIVVTVPALGFRARFFQGNAYTLLWEYTDNTRFGIVTADASFLTNHEPDTIRITDVGYWTIARLPLEVEPPVPLAIVPDLSVEIAFGAKTLSEARERMEEHLASGVRMVWLVEPELQTVTVYRTPDEGRLLHTTAFLSGEDVLPGFQCSVADFFA